MVSIIRIAASIVIQRAWRKKQLSQVTVKIKIVLHCFLFTFQRLLLLYRYFFVSNNLKKLILIHMHLEMVAKEKTNTQRESQIFFAQYTK